MEFEKLTEKERKLYSEIEHLIIMQMYIWINVLFVIINQQN